jgi:hypothetical protein
MGYKTTNLDFSLARNYEKVGYFFDSLADINKFFDDVMKDMQSSPSSFAIADNYYDKAKRKARVRASGADWYGAIDDSFVDNKISRYSSIDRVQNEVLKLSTRIAKKSFVDIDQVKRIEFTDKEVGIFSFDMASLGLVRVYEYYSPLLKRIVSANFVKSEKTGSGENLFYYQGTPFVPKHKIEYVGKQGGYYSEILKRLVDKDDLIEEEGEDRIVVLYYPEMEKIEKHEVERKQKIGEDGKKKFATTFKKCFIEIKKVKNQLPRVDIIVPIGYNAGVTADQSFWNCIQVLSICEKLTKSGVNYRIIASSSSETITGRKRIYNFINLKNENQPLDPNQLSIIVSDMRFNRMDGFLLDFTTQYNSGFSNLMNSGVSGTVSNSTEIKNAYMNFLSKQTSQSDINASQFPNSKIVLNYALNEQQALDGYENTIQLIERL